MRPSGSKPPPGPSSRPVEVVCYPVTPDSNYVPLLFDGIGDRYRPVYLAAAGLHTAAWENVALLHVHWEEFVLRDCRTVAQAEAAMRAAANRLAEIRCAGVRVFWTVHNEVPHDIGFRRQFLALRRRLAEIADVILLHNDLSLPVLKSQVELDAAKVRMLPHPSYLGRLESEAAVEAGLAQPHERRIQGFGWLRAQKGFGQMIEMLPAEYLQARRAVIRISGHGPEAAAITRRAGRADVQWDVRYVPDAELPGLLRTAACVILPYQRVLTSGVALLALSVGALPVAVDIPQLRAVLPAAAQRFLYPRGDGAALRAVIDDVLSLSTSERRSLVAANLAVARSLHPRIIAARLADLYDQALSGGCHTGASARESGAEVVRGASRPTSLHSGSMPRPARG